MKRVYLEDLICAAILAFFAMQGAIPGIAPNQALEATNGVATGLMKVGGIVSQIVIDGSILFLVLRHLRLLYRHAHAMQYAGLLAILALLSTFWSLDPLLTVRRSLPFALAALFGLYLATKFPVRRQLSVFWMAMIVLALGSIVLATCFPAIGLERSAGHQGDWQGVFTQKNACGRVMVLATAVVLAHERLSLAKITSMLIFIFVLIMSGSRGAWIIEAAVIALFCLLRSVSRSNSRSRVLILLAAVIGCIVLAFATWLYLPLLTKLIGRDTTFSGRTEIWAQVWAYILKRPIAGYGYAAFWQGMKGESFNVAAAVHFIVFHAHNGFLEIWLELGGAGLVLFTFSYFRAWRKLWPALCQGQINRIAWMLFILVLIALYDLDENTLLTANGLFWVVYVSALVNIEYLAVEDSLVRGIGAHAQERRAYAASLALSQ